MVGYLVAIAVLLVLSAFFSGSETALTAASRPFIHQLEQTGNRRAGIVRKLHEQQARLLSALLLGNNLVNILASALATGIMIEMFGPTGVAYATLAMTLLVLVFAEVIPKTYAFRHANQTALAVGPVVRLLVFVLNPPVQFLLLVVRGIFKLFGSDIQGDEAVRGDEELRGAIELHNGDDTAVRHERAMLRSILDLTEVQVGEIMVHRRNVVTIDADEPPAEIVSQVLASPYTRIPLWRESADNIVGVLHVKALLRAVQAQEGSNLDTLDIVALAGTPWFIPEYTPLLDQLLAFRERHEHFALVVDEYGSLMGIVTLEDILEEIVGDISDEHDVSVSGVRLQPDGSYVVDGDVTIRDLNREFEWDLPDEEAATVAGLVLHETRRIPEVGQTFLFHDFRFEILRRQRHQITSVRVIPPETGPEEKSGKE